jgi:hypothetical protein
MPRTIQTVALQAIQTLYSVLQGRIEALMMAPSIELVRRPEARTESVEDRADRSSLDYLLARAAGE